MRIGGIIWMSDVIAKLASKHGVEPLEVEETLQSKPAFRRLERGARIGEDVYLALGQTRDGRHLSVIFIRKLSGDALILSARNMAAAERRCYEKR